MILDVVREAGADRNHVQRQRNCQDPPTRVQNCGLFRDARDIAKYCDFQRQNEQNGRYA